MAPFYKPLIPPHLLLGRTGESIAEIVMLANGYTIIDKNWRIGHLELDLICEKGEEVIFVEVKTRSSAKFGGPSGAITPRKTAKLIKAASAWLSLNDAWHRPCRFDVICLTGKNTYSLEYYYNAINMAGACSGGNATWQP